MNRFIADRERAHASVADWLKNGWAIGVFENHDLGSANVGLRVALPFDARELEGAVIGSAKAPDGSYGLGWRYILIAKPTTVDETIAMIYGDGDGKQAA